MNSEALPDRTAESRAILVADDSDTNRILIAHYFRGTPWRLDFAVDGHDAVARFASGRYALILMDIRMPDMDGHEATRRIRALEAERDTPPTPIVAITADAFREQEARCRAAGCTDFLAKPVRKDDLLRCVARHARP